MNSRIYLDDDWQFFENFTEKLINGNFEAEKPLNVRIPHTVKEVPLHYFDENLYQMNCCYVRTLVVLEAWRDKRVLLTFDGVGHDCDVFLNGVLLARHHCGYTAFTVDLTGKISFETKNLLAVRVNSREAQNIPPFGFVIDYMTFGGIYRDVYLEIKNQTYISDVFFKPDVNLATGECTISSDVTLSGENAQNTERFVLQQSISEHKANNFSVLKNENGFASCGKLKLWSPETPNLYDVKTELIEKSSGKSFDEKTVTIGFRKAEFKANGFFLNGDYYKIRGLNRHQSYPYVGYAMPESMQKMDAAVLKNELGVNAVRTSHYPQSHYFLDACDELGLLVFTEIPGWQHIGNDEWKNQAVENVREMVGQYRNHCSIIIWGVRINESKDDDEFYARTNEMAHKLDPTRQTGGVKAYKKASTLEDVYNYNDFSHHGTNDGVEPKKNVVPNMNLPYFVTEYNGHMFPTKTFDCEEHRSEHALRHAKVLDSVAGYDDIAGSFGWCMADYNTHKDFGSGDRICYHGVLDMFRNPKLAASVYASQQENVPVLEIGSSMDIGEHPACMRGDIYIFTNADSVKMYKNDNFIKEYTSKGSAFKNLKHGPILIDDFIGDAIEKDGGFKPGQIKAMKTVLNITAREGTFHLSKKVILNAAKLVLFYHMSPSSAVTYFQKYIGDWGGKSTVYKFEAIKDGKVVKTVIKEPMKNVHFAYDCDHTNLVEKNSYDVACVRLRACDDNGNVLNFCNDPVSLRTEGPIEIIGPKTISFQGGLTGTYVKTTGKAGKATLFIESEAGKNILLEFNVDVQYTKNN